MVDIGKINDAYHSAAADNAHFCRHAVCTSAVNDEIVVHPHLHLVAHHACGNELIALELLQDAAVRIGRIVSCIAQCITQRTVFLLQAYVVARQLLIHLAQSGEGNGILIDAVHCRSRLVRCRQPYVALVTIEAHKHDDAENLQQKEEEEIVVSPQEVEKNLHE